MVQKEDDEWTGSWRVRDSIDPGVWATRNTSDGSTYKHPIGALYGKYKDEDLKKQNCETCIWLLDVTN